MDIVDNYFVNDLIPDITNNIRILFIFESPYKKEIEHGHPIAGSSGRSIGKHLNRIIPEIPDNIPFGCYLKKSNDERFAAMNCCNYPLDKAAYPADMISINNWQINDLNKIRLKLSQSNKINDSLAVTFNFLSEDFKNRLSKINYTKAIKVLCGKFAQHFYYCSNLSMDGKFITVPHPSRNQWNHQRYSNVIQNMLNQIKEKIVFK